MPAQMLDGRGLARALRQELAQEVVRFREQTGVAPGLAIVQVGADPAAERYVQNLERGLLGIGMGSRRVTLPDEASATRLAEALEQLNLDATVHGVIVQMPLPAHIPATTVHLLSPAKDVDGMHPLNAGLLLQGSTAALAPATPLGGLALLEHYGIPLEGREAVVVGRSRIVGLPMALLLLQRHATVTLCHSRTPALGEVTRRAEILAVAVGRPRLITPAMVRPGATVLDFGINVVEGEVVGDVDPTVAEVAAYLTPVPGGTGPLTNIMLMRNTLQAAWQQIRGQA